MKIQRARTAKLATMILLGMLGVASGAPGSAPAVSGKVTLQGQPMKAKIINMASEPGCAKVYSTPPTTEDVVVVRGVVSRTSWFTCPRVRRSRAGRPRSRSPWSKKAAGSRRTSWSCRPIRKYV